MADRERPGVPGTVLPLTRGEERVLMIVLAIAVIAGVVAVGLLGWLIVRAVWS